MTVTPADVIDLDRTRFHYECSEGHLILNAEHQQLACLVYVRGDTCPGVLRRFGPGSRSGGEAKA